MIEVNLLEKFVHKYKTPLLLLSTKKIIENYNTLRELLPTTHIFYSVKANPHIEILKTLNSIGANFEIASYGELKLLKKLNINTDRIINSNPIKSVDEIKYQVREEINWFVFDNYEELNKLQGYKNKVNLLLRISSDNPSCQVNLSYKFGIEPDKAPDIIEYAKKEGFNIRGLCFHIGSQNINPYIYGEVLKTCKNIFNLSALKGIFLDTLNIGGGFPVKYIEEVPPINNICEIIQENLDKYFANCNIFVEPGRFISANAVTLLTRVIGKAVRSGIKWYYIDDSIYGSFSGIVYDKCRYEVYTTKSSDKKEQCIIAGRTCDSFDVIFSNIILPELEVGDILIIPNMGAYTMASASNFNGFLPARVVKYE